MRKYWAYFELLTLIGITACGGSGGTTPPPTDPTPPPVIENPQVNTPNLAPFAKITANSAVSDDFAADFAADGIKPDVSNLRTYMWVPAAANANSAVLTMSWNSQVKITEIKLFDNPAKDQQITKGKVEFVNETDPALSFGMVDFAALPDDAASPVSIPGPSQPITGFKIHILDHKGGSAGLAEVMALGTRVEESIAEGNVMPFCKISKYSSVLGPVDKDTDTGAHRTSKVKDEVDTGSEWITNGNGANASIEIECDRNYSVTEVTLVDRVSNDIFWPAQGTRFKGANFHFTDLNEKVRVVKTAQTDPSATLTLPEAKSSKKFMVNFESDDIFDGLNSGLSEIKIKGSVTE